MRSQSCPNENDLADYVMHVPGASSVEGHLDTCVLCRATAARMAELAFDDGAASGPKPRTGGAGTSDDGVESGPKPRAGASAGEEGVASGPQHRTGAHDTASVTEPDGADVSAASAEAGALLCRGDRVGRYAVVEMVGAGAMGTVYAAHDPELDRTVALKLLRPELGRGPKAAALRARLAREARAIARISHPNVITVYDTGAIGDQLFVAMELVGGGTLRSWLAKETRSWREILDVYLAAGRGLAAAHSAGIVHRDFKPDNVLMGEDGRVRVTDFGLSSAGWEGDATEVGADVEDEPTPSMSRATLTATGALIGTPVYMAPEQLAGGVASTRTDLFSFCVALYEALYGERPFSGPTLDDLRRSMRAPVRDPPAKTRVPLWIRRAILRGLAVDPSARPASMIELVDALARGAAGQRVRGWPAVLGVGLAIGVWAAAMLVLGEMGFVSWRGRAAPPSVASATPPQVAAAIATIVPASAEPAAPPPSANAAPTPSETASAVAPPASSAGRAAARRKTMEKPIEKGKVQALPDHAARPHEASSPLDPKGIF